MPGYHDCALSYKAKRSYSESFEHRDAFWGWSIYEQRTGRTGIGRNEPSDEVFRVCVWGMIDWTTRWPHLNVASQTPKDWVGVCQYFQMPGRDKEEWGMRKNYCVSMWLLAGAQRENSEHMKKVYLRNVAVGGGGKWCPPGKNYTPREKIIVYSVPTRYQTYLPFC